MKRLLFTHGADIDGIGNAILAKLAFENIDIIYARNVSDLETKFLNEYNSGNLYNYDIVYITDLSLKKEIADKVYNDDKLKDKLYIFDHHETALASGLNEYNNTNVHVELNGIKTCGTELYYNYLKDNGYLEDSTAISEFVEKVRREDNWEWEKYNDILAHDLAILFNAVGINRFVDSMVALLKEEKDSFELNENLSNEVNNKKEKIKLAIESSKRFVRKELIDGIKTLIVFITYEYRNDVADYFKKNNDIDYDVVAMIALDNDQISIRSLKSNNYARILAEKYGGGGHDTAAAIPLDYNNKSKIVDTLFKF